MLKIGRGQQNDIVLDDPDQVVSRFHAELRPEAAGYVLVDLNSQNGTWVDAERVDRVAMRTGVPVVIGPYELSSKTAAPGDRSAQWSKRPQHSDATR